MDTTKFLLTILLEERLRAAGKASKTTFHMFERYNMFNKLKPFVEEVEEHMQRMEEFDLFDLSCIDEILDEIYVGELHWGKIVTSLAVASKLCSHFIRGDRDELAYETINRVYYFLERKRITHWIENEYLGMTEKGQQKPSLDRRNPFIQITKQLCLLIAHIFKMYNRI
jgi:hypothetical protein